MKAPVLLPIDAPADEAGSRALAALRLREGRWQQAAQRVAEERPVALQYNGVSHAVMLATPADLEDFAVGFSLSEGIVAAADEVHDLDIESSGQGVTVAMKIAASRFDALKQRRRSLAGRTGCGLCGVDSLAQALPELTPLHSDAVFAASAVLAAMQALRAHQPLHDETGATHAAGFADAQGRLLCVREDVGRHNALDKVIGALARGRVDATRGLVLITSRASHEMVAKAARAGIPLVAAVSGVTTLAAQTAHDTAVCLAGFARGDDLTAYAHAQRLAGATAPKA
ncbi:MAG: hypothetical protein RIQ96_729 [Pseudomonadota bacterium]